jgi:rubrerythrin
MQEEFLIKTFINKAIASVKYSYYAKKSGENGFCGEEDELKSIAQNKLYEAFALLSRLGFEDCEKYLEEVVESEQKQILEQKQFFEKEKEEWIESLINSDEHTLKRANDLVLLRKSENAYKENKCALCSYKDKSGKNFSRCPRCGGTLFLAR